MKKLCSAIIALLLTVSVQATPTKVLVRVKAKDAKFIGTGIGGALVLIKDHLTGELLAKGLTKGSSGSTDVILKTALIRGQSIVDAQTAVFEANIDIQDPTLIDISVVAPVNRLNAAVNGSTQLWLLPGKNIAGDGVIIELSGYILDILTPNSHQLIALDSIKSHSLDIKVSLTMLCGCPISKGGVWDADHIEIKAILKKEGVTTGTFPLNKLPGNNLFNGQVPIAGKGNYEVLVYAYDAATNNTGLDRINFVIQ
ncbi:hypothetical protein GA0116948_10533 [Chitinophaga costaii]|uniref:Ig-like domain-containing protein n=1 Tax=Chitinophaga costaii TaxID=1335309 RepID=A0A1C4D2G3_9BACT|nr:hypothetical protein [Chitinophaga costaii]PUZ24429.1 hypothetical protein DCM91_10950 [Chitinophaga costaii]SCC25476.1 hypothetical protein GA0116948_10533 [Chitinophaga costaii]